jgi:hypothetical protein
MILFKVLTKKLVKDGASQFQNFRVNLHRFHATFFIRLSQLVYVITSITEDGFRNCSRVRTKRRELLTFLEGYHKDVDEILKHIVGVTETYVSFVNAESKEQSNQWMHTFTKQGEKV